MTTQSDARTSWFGLFGLLLLIYAGSIKGTAVFSWVPIDLTLLGLALVAAGVLRRWESLSQINGYLWPVIWVYLVLVTVGMAGFSSNPYATEKIAKLIFVNPLILIAGSVLVSSAVARRRLLVGIFTGGLLLALLIGVFPTPQDETGRIVIEGTNTIALGRGVGVASLVLVGTAAFSQGASRKQRMFLACAAIPFIVLSLSLGARGPILSSLGALLITGAMSHSRKTALLWGGAVGIFSFILSVTSGVLSGRTVQLTDPTRMALWKQSLAIGIEHPFGIGWGQLSKHGEFSVGLGTRQYSHNIFIEVFAEAGVVGALCLLCVTILAVASQTRRMNTSRLGIELTLNAVLVFFVLSALTSGDINDNRAFWVLVGVGLVGMAKGCEAESGIGSSVASP